MSDDEDPWAGRDSEEEQEEEEKEEEEEEEEEEETKPAFKPKPAAPPPQPVQKTEAQLAMEKRRAEALKSADANTQELLRVNSEIRQQEEEEIAEMRARIEQRKAERRAEEARMAEQRAEEDARRKAEEDERRRKKDEEEIKRREARAKKMAEFEKWKNPSGPNFVITKKARGEGEVSTTSGKEETQKSKEQLEAEKKAILAQRIQPLSVDGLGLTELIAKATELHNTIFRLESDKYDMETRFKKGQADMVELAERARQMSRGGKGKATRVDTESVDKFQEKFGAPPKISLCSSFERRKDKRSYAERHTCFEGPQYLYPVDKINPQKQVVWGYEGPEYSGGAPPPRREPEPEAPAPEPEADQTAE